MKCMAEDDFGCTFRFERNVPRNALVAADTILFIGNAESLDSRVAGSAGFGFFHLRHGKVTKLSDIENCVMAYSAVVIVFKQVEVVTENNGIGVSEFELDIFCFLCL